MSGRSPSCAPSPRCLAALAGGLGKVSIRIRRRTDHAPLTLQKVGGALAHAGVYVRLGRLDVVVEVVAEGLDVGDDVGHALRREVAREEDYTWLAIVPAAVVPACPPPPSAPHQT
jgi:hypothetical protein